jgi:hypothetical protein
MPTLIDLSITQRATRDGLVECMPRLAPHAQPRAQSLVDWFDTRGRWTTGQHEFAQRLVDGARATPAPIAIGDGLARIHQLFATARANGLARPRLTVDGVQIAPSRSNADALNIRADGEYAGTIVGGIFRGRGRAGDGNVATVLQRLAIDPARTLTAHGHATGRCGVCSRPLSDPVSVAMGIGPICASRFGISREGVTPAPTSVTTFADPAAPGGERTVVVPAPTRAPRVRTPHVPAEAHAIAANMTAARAATLAQQAANVRNRHRPAGSIGREFGDDDVLTAAY